MSTDVGRCGDASPSFIGSPPDICALPAGHPGWHRGDLPLHGRATEWSDARPAAPDATAGDGLREVQAWIDDATNALRAATTISERMWRTGRVEGLHLASHDRLVGTAPALSDVLAAAARDADAVARVRAAVQEAGPMMPRAVVRRALDPS